MNDLLLTQSQIGAYFGAEVCTIDVDNDSQHYTDLILISAPMFMDDNREGRVYVCGISGLVNATFIQSSSSCFCSRGWQCKHWIFLLGFFSFHQAVDCHFDSPLVLRGDAVGEGRFGSSLAALPDLNKDTLNDLVVGAPLENDRQGSIYIFNGEGQGSINPKYSQVCRDSK